MRSISVVVNLFVLFSSVNALVSPRHSTLGGAPKSTALTSSLISSFFPPPADASSPRPPNRPPPFSLEPDVIFGRCKAVLATDLCIREPSLLAPEFMFVGPYIEPLNKDEYIAAGRFFDLRRTFPDLDYRAHDFRIVETDGNLSKAGIVTVRCTLRTTGQMRGELRLRNEVLPPNGKRMVCPPEAFTIKLDATSGLVLQLCSGFVMDRLVGNTGGLCGIMAAATVAGAPPSEWELYPPTTVLSRFFGRSVKQLPLEPSSFLAPFPETVMIQLAKGVLASDYGTKDTSLLSKDFSFCGPLVGPIGKEQFLEMMGKFNTKKIFPNLSEQFSNFRVDPYDPYRVWVDLEANGVTKEGLMFEGPAEAISLTFDDDGFCTRLTAGAVMDPTVGNTRGLGGILGMQFSLGQTSPWNTRPISQLFSPEPKYTSNPPPAPKQNAQDEVKVTASLPPKTTVTQSSNILSVSPATKTKAESTSTTSPSRVQPKDQPSQVKTLQKQMTEPSVPKNVNIAKKVDSKIVTSKLISGSSILKTAQKATKSTDLRKTPLLPKKKATTPALNTDKKDTNIKIVGSQSPTATKVANKQTFKDSEMGKTKSLPMIGLMKTSNLQVQGKEQKAKSTGIPATTKINSTKANVPPSLPAKKSTIIPPKGVPMLKQWKKDKDGSISGSIYGSKSFKDGDAVTTSIIASGSIEKGSVVTTSSGSKYFLA